MLLRSLHAFCMAQICPLLRFWERGWYVLRTILGPPCVYYSESGRGANQTYSRVTLCLQLRLLGPGNVLKGYSVSLTLVSPLHLLFKHLGYQNYWQPSGLRHTAFNTFTVNRTQSLYISTARCVCNSRHSIRVSRLGPRTSGCRKCYLGPTG